MKNAKEMLEHVAKFSEKMFLEHGEIQPMWVLESATEIVPIVAPFDGDESKDIIANFVRNKAKEMKAEVSGFMAEAWMVSLDKNQKLEKMPSEHEDRREIIQVFAEDKSGVKIMGTYYILRPEYGKAKLSPFKIMDGSAEGRFTSMLEKA